jgi:hypothetical protein
MGLAVPHNCLVSSCKTAHLSVLLLSSACIELPGCLSVRSVAAGPFLMALDSSNNVVRVSLL